MYNIRFTISIKSGNIDLSDSEQDLFFATNPKAKLKGDFIGDGYPGTSVAAIGNSLVANTTVSDIGNGHFWFSLTDRKVTSFGLEHDLSNKCIMIWYATNYIYLPNGTASGWFKETLLIHGGANYLISTSQAPYFGMDVLNVGKFYSGKQYIHGGYWTISMNFYKALFEK